MFKRLIVEDWQSTMHIVAMLLFIGVFVSAFIRILRRPRSWIDHISALPLEKDNTHTAHEHVHKTDRH